MPENTYGPSFNHMELVDAVAGETGVDRDVVADVLRGAFDVIGRTLASRGTVTVTNFGRFSTYTRGARNPLTGETGFIATTARFRSSGSLKRAVRSGEVPETFKKRPSPRPSRRTLEDGFAPAS